MTHRSADTQVQVALIAVWNDQAGRCMLSLDHIQSLTTYSTGRTIQLDVTEAA